jgi:PadR family transcriptional regulator, regulatory protein PadR
LVKSEWSTTENNREAKYYRLSAAGQRALATEMNDWRKFAGAVDLVLLAEEAR